MRGYGFRHPCHRADWLFLGPETECGRLDGALTKTAEEFLRVLRSYPPYRKPSFACLGSHLITLVKGKLCAPLEPVAGGRLDSVCWPIPLKAGENVSASRRKEVMTMDYQRIILLGNTTAKPQVKQAKNEIPYALFSVGVGKGRTRRSSSR